MVELLQLFATSGTATSVLIMAVVLRRCVGSIDAMRRRIDTLAGDRSSSTWKSIMTDVPRRLSSDDADFQSWVGRLFVHVDGVEQSGIVSAYDLDAGTVVRAKLNEQGEIYADGDTVATETIRGNVVVSLRPVDSHPSANALRKDRDRAVVQTCETGSSDAS